MPNSRYAKWLFCQMAMKPNGIMPNGVEPQNAEHVIFNRDISSYTLVEIFINFDCFFHFYLKKIS